MLDFIYGNNLKNVNLKLPLISRFTNGFQIERISIISESNRSYTFRMCGRRVNCETEVLVRGGSA